MTDMQIWLTEQVGFANGIWGTVAETNSIPDCVRDYIYLDTNRAKSIYSQLRHGLVHSYLKGNETAESSIEIPTAAVKVWSTMYSWVRIMSTRM